MSSRLTPIPGVTQILLAGWAEWLEVHGFTVDLDGVWLGQPTPTFTATAYSPKGQKSATIQGPTSSIAATFSPDI